MNIEELGEKYEALKTEEMKSVEIIRNQRKEINRLVDVVSAADDQIDALVAALKETREALAVAIKSLRGQPLFYGIEGRRTGIAITLAEITPVLAKYEDLVKKIK